ncbi:MAG TPA: hypothetical protein DEO40_07020 [Treponema sp.]|nr:hypothetical protein [Treponema sp.]
MDRLYQIEKKKSSPLNLSFESVFFYFGMLILFVEVWIYVKHYFFNIAFFVIIYKMERGG